MTALAKKLAIIYEPKGAAREYAPLALNLYNGCTHRCVYCYNNGRYSKAGEFFKSARPRMGISRRIASDARDLLAAYGDKCPEVLISFIGDAYQPAETTLGQTRLAIRILIDHQIPFTILTKSAGVCRDFDLLSAYREKFRLGMSFTSVDRREVDQWEPGARHIDERILALSKAKTLGIRTWVSLEPVMSIKSAVKVISALHPHVDFWWVGKLNHMQPPQPINWAEAMREIMATLEFYRCRYEFKKSFLDL